MENNFEELKKELITKAKEQRACSSEYKRALSASNEKELLEVVSDNLNWCIENECISHEYFKNFDIKEYLESGIANTGKENTGYSNSGNWNSGNRNSGNRNSGNSNSGNSNSGNSNSGYSNSGYSNSGNSNSGNSNSGNWNSGNWNSGYCNSGYRNSGAFCTDQNPKIMLFDSPTDMYVKDLENSRAYQLMSNNLSFTFWIYESDMSEEEKAKHPSCKTTGGFLKTISYKEGWANFWGDLTDSDKKEFISLPNFDSVKFESITGIKI